MRTAEKKGIDFSKMVDLSQVKVDPNLRSNSSDPFVQKKVAKAKEMLKNVDLTILDDPNKLGS